MTNITIKPTDLEILRKEPGFAVVYKDNIIRTPGRNPVEHLSKKLIEYMKQEFIVLEVERDRTAE